MGKKELILINKIITMANEQYEKPTGPQIGGFNFGPVEVKIYAQKDGNYLYQTFYDGKQTAGGTEPPPPKKP